MTVANGDVKFSYTSKYLNDYGTPTLSKIWNGSAMESKTENIFSVFNSLRNLSGEMLYDANGDGKLTSSDYALYNQVYIIDGSDVQLAKVFPSYTKGKTLKVKGTDYLVTGTSNGGQSVSLGHLISATLYNVSKVDTGNARIITGSSKMQFVKNSNTTGYLAIIGSSGVQYKMPLNLSSLTATPWKDITKNITSNSDAFDGYKIFVNASTSTSTSISVELADTSQISTISNGQSGAFGYYGVKVNATSFGSGSGTSGSGAGKLIFLSSPITLVPDGSVAVPDTYYKLKYDIGRELSVGLSKTVTVPSGTTMKDSYSKYAPIVNDATKSFTVTVTGGTAATPELAIVNEDTASSSMNHVLIGGPVANKMTAQLVESGASKVDWYNSSGNIEVVSGHPAAGMYSIIVAGKARTQTRAAADALAAWL